MGVAANGRVWMGGDTCASDKVSQVQVRYPKVFKFRIPVRINKKFVNYEEMIVGCSGSFRMMQVLEHGLIPPIFNDSDRSVMSYLTMEFTDALRELFNAKGVIRKGKDYESFGGSIMIGFRGELFHMEDSYTLISIEGNEFAAGSGADFALGSLYTSRMSEWDVEARVKEALETAAFFNLQTKGPFFITNV